MKINEQQRGGIALLSLDGDFIGETDRSDLAASIQRVLGSGSRRFVIDLRGVHHINSSGLGSLVSALTTVRRAGGELRLSNANPDVHHLFEMTQLIKVFEFHGSVEQALARYGTAAADT